MDKFVKELRSFAIETLTLMINFGIELMMLRVHVVGKRTQISMPGHEVLGEPQTDTVGVDDIMKYMPDIALL